MATMIAITPDMLWTTLREEAERVAAHEPVLADFLRDAILRHTDFAGALGAYLASKLANGEIGARELEAIIAGAYRDEPAIVDAAAVDLAASKERDPAYSDHLTPLLYFKGYPSLQWYRVTHWLWTHDRRALATYLHSRVSEIFAVDIHPGARFGRGIFIDHATGIVVGETAVVGDDVSILHAVTLGGTGKVTGDRHPKVGSGVLIGAGAKILGNIRIGDCAKIGAGSVVLRDVPAHTTAAGVPARLVGVPSEAVPALTMNQDFSDFQI
jgi:serine O-acetyltransferase